MRRIVAAVALFAGVLALSACGSSSKSDKDKVTELIKDVGKNPATLCTKYASADLMTAVGGDAACQKLAAEPSSKDPNVKVDSVVITGAEAIAKVTGNTGHQQIKLVKQGGDWKVTAVTSAGG